MAGIPTRRERQCLRCVEGRRREGFTFNEPMQQAAHASWSGRRTSAPCRRQTGRPVRRAEGRVPGYRPSRGRAQAIGHQKTPQRDCFPQSRSSNNATTISPTASSARPTFERRHLRPGRYQRRQGGGFRHRLRRDDRFRKGGFPPVTRDNASLASCRHDP